MMWRQIKPELHWVLCLFLCLFYVDQDTAAMPIVCTMNTALIFSDGRTRLNYVCTRYDRLPPVRCLSTFWRCVNRFEGKTVLIFYRSFCFCRDTLFLTSFCDWNMPASCSSESWNQHHGELLSGKRKAALLTTVRQIHFILCTRTVYNFLSA